MSTTIEKQQCLISAVIHGNINNVKKYLNDGSVNVNGTDRDGWTALHYACSKGYGDIAELLLDHGADIDARSYYNDTTPLHFACLYDHASTTKLLLDRGCAVNSVRYDGETALHTACRLGSMECVKELLAHGADTTVKDNNGKTPLDVAKRSKNQSIIDLVMEHEKRSEKSLMDSIQSVQIVSELTSTIKAQASSTEERILSRVEAIISRRCEELRQDMVANKKEMNDTVKKLLSDQKKLLSGHESKVETIINDRCQEQKSDLNSSSQDKMVNQSLDKLTNQLSTSYAESTKCFSNLATMMRHLSSKKSSIEGSLDDTNEETMARMYQSLQRLRTSNHLNDSNENAGISAGASASGIASEGQKDVEDFEKEEDSLGVLKNIQDELHQSLTYCQSMLS